MRREALLLAVDQVDVEALIAAAPRLLDEHEPLDALRHWSPGSPPTAAAGAGPPRP